MHQLFCWSTNHTHAASASAILLQQHTHMQLNQGTTRDHSHMCAAWHPQFHAESMAITLWWQPRQQHTASCTTDCADSANQPTSHSTKAQHQQQGKRTNFTAWVGVFIQPRSRVTHSRRSSPTLLTEARPLSSCMSPLPTAFLDAQSHSTQTMQRAHCWYTYTQPAAQSTMAGATLRPMHTASSATFTQMP
jgi:hypothetical protein